MIRLRQEGRDMPRAPTFLISGAKGSLVDTDISRRDILDHSNDRDVLEGPLATTPSLVRAEDHVT